jgi:hypothetical protein
MCTKAHKGYYTYHQDYTGMRNKIRATCSVHQLDFMVEAGAHLKRLNGCPQCSLSKGEILVGNWLTDNNIQYETQKRFDDCRRKFPLPFDFYLPDLNICIEFDGDQHSIPVELWGGEDTLKLVRERDLIKDTYCRKNSIILIRIPYKDRKNLNKHLNQLKL